MVLFHQMSKRNSGPGLQDYELPDDDKFQHDGIQEGNILSCRNNSLGGK